MYFHMCIYIYISVSLFLNNSTRLSSPDYVHLYIRIVCSLRLRATEDIVSEGGVNTFLDMLMQTVDGALLVGGSQLSCVTSIGFSIHVLPMYITQRPISCS